MSEDKKAIDLVKPLVAIAVGLWDRYEYEVHDATRRRVSPTKAPAATHAYARFRGACELLAEMWLQLGADPSEMNADLAVRAVQKEVDRIRDERQRAVEEEFVVGVRHHAEVNRDLGLWDRIVKEWSDAELYQVVRGCQTLTQAIETTRDVLELLDMYCGPKNGSWDWAQAQAREGEVVWRTGWADPAEHPEDSPWIGWHEEAVTLYRGNRVLGRFSPNAEDSAATDWRSTSWCPESTE